MHSIRSPRQTSHITTTQALKDKLSVKSLDDGTKSFDFSYLTNWIFAIKHLSCIFLFA